MVKSYSKSIEQIFIAAALYKYRCECERLFLIKSQALPSEFWQEELVAQQSKVDEIETLLKAMSVDEITIMTKQDEVNPEKYEQAGCKQKDYIPPAFTLCPEEFDKIKLLVTILFGWELLTVEYFGTDECTEFQLEIDRRYPHFLSRAGELGMKVGKTYWVNPSEKCFRLVDEFNPFVSLDDAFLILEGLRGCGTWILEFPDIDNARATFTPRIGNPISFFCCSLFNSITTVAFQWIQNQFSPSFLELTQKPNDAPA